MNTSCISTSIPHATLGALRQRYACPLLPKNWQYVSNTADGAPQSLNRVSDQITNNVDKGDELIAVEVHPDVLSAIRWNAKLVVSSQNDLAIKLAYDEASVEWLDGFINRARDPGLVHVLGSFLGECIVRTYGGRWVIADGTLAVQFQNGFAFPFGKTLNQLENGSDDSVLGYFQLIPGLLLRFGSIQIDQ